ncbi:hypothetical protein SAY87_031807 [Trapa incisa]|uniref:Uncharacterized protein n=2 Tax=Trapa TaxID=22665 RepID=A0AAN7RAK5_TRANT|nr:hypothetical protein SAY87_031807 [Trapa incisa]KAK4795932.1 hypothetical protein SAY86_028258 [Trapa natans]
MLTREQRQRKSSFELIKQGDDKFFSRLLSRETAADSNSSFRFHYDGPSGSVPFFWESRPGTPKHPLDELAIPPLTPPPSYHKKLSFSGRSSNPGKKFLSSKSNLLRILFLKARGKKPSGEITASKCRTDQASGGGGRDDDILVFPSLNKALREDKVVEKRRFTSRGSSSSSEWSLNDGDQMEERSPASTLCFGAMRSASAGQHPLAGTRS